MVKVDYQLLRANLVASNHTVIRYLKSVKDVNCLRSV